MEYTTGKKYVLFPNAIQETLGPGQAGCGSPDGTTASRNPTAPRVKNKQFHAVIIYDFDVRPKSTRCG
jgi:hypothetical protein